MSPDGLEGGQGRSSDDVRRDAFGCVVLLCLLFWGLFFLLFVR